MATKLAAVVALLALSVAGFGATTILVESGGSNSASVPQGTPTIALDVMLNLQYGDVYATSGGLYGSSQITVGGITYAGAVFPTWTVWQTNLVGSNLEQGIDFGSMADMDDPVAAAGVQKFATVTLNIGTLAAGVYTIRPGDGMPSGQFAGMGYWASTTAPPGDDGNPQSFDSVGTFTLTVQSGGSNGNGGSGKVGTAPTVGAVQAQTGLTVDVTFSGAMGTGVTTPDNYTVSGTGQGTLASHPSSVALVSGNTYRLTWTTGEMKNGGDITITVANVQDQAGTAIGSPNSGMHSGGGIGTAPTVSTVQVQTGLTVDVTFSEAMGTGVTTADNYTVSGTGMGTLADNPSSVAPVSGNTYRLTWAEGQMVNGGDITIKVANAQDLAGNMVGNPNRGTHTGGGIGPGGGSDNTNGGVNTNNGSSTDQTGGTDNSIGQPQQEDNTPSRPSCGAGVGGGILLLTAIGLLLIHRRRSF